MLAFLPSMIDEVLEVKPVKCLKMEEPELVL
jgi:hypothetical protein